MMDEGYFRKVWSLADFRHHSAQYGIQKVPSDWRLHSMKYTPVGVDIGKRAARTVLTGMCYSVGSATRQGSSSPTRFIGQSAMTSRT